MDREFRLAVIHPILSKILKSDGILLEIGFNPYSRRICEYAKVPCDRWHFVDPEASEHFDRRSGHFHKNEMAALLPAWKHKFRVILDYGVLGFLPRTWEKGKIDEHISAYSQLLEPGGMLFLKFDGRVPNTGLWPEIRDKISSKLVLVHKHLQISEGCSKEKKIEFKKWDETTEGEPHTTYSLDAVIPPGRDCDFNIYAQWYYPGDLYSLKYYGENV